MKEVYQLAAGMIGQEERIAQIANNLANVNTVGFKKQGMAFRDFMMLAEAAGQAATAPNAATAAANPAGMVWPAPGAAYVDHTMGPMEQTGRPLDLVIEGEGFFQVEVDDQIYYTRAGNFTLDAEGRLVTTDGHRVLSANGGELKLNRTAGAPQIAPDGDIRQDGESVGRIGVIRFEDPKQVLPHGGGLFEAPEDAERESVETPSMRSGMLERSNVDAIREMIDMIEIQRAYDLNQKMIQSIDDITRKRIDSIVS
jgi:flagellar basal-body rod protein FlgF